MDRSSAEPGPRLAPHAVLLRRSPTELQLGVEPAVVVPATYGPLVRALADGATATELTRVAHADGLHAGAVTELLGALRDARLLRPPTAAAGRPVRLVGAGILGTRLAHELARAGVGTLYLADLPDRASSDEPPADRRRRRAPRLDRVEVLAGSLAGRPGLQVRRSRHFVKPEGSTVALTLVVADGPEPDRLVSDLLREHAAPHLLVRCSGDTAVVGPLVVPGVTSCVRCADLTRRDADPRWPWLLDQLTRLPLDPVATVLAWAAVTATVEALAYVGGGRPQTLGHTLELGTDDHTTRRRAWPVHPECPCRWDDAPGSSAPA